MNFYDYPEYTCRACGEPTASVAGGLCSNCREQEAIDREAWLDNEEMEMEHERYTNAPLHDLYPLEVEYPSEDTGEYDPEDFEDVDDDTYMRFLKQLTIDHMTLPYISDDELDDDTPADGYTVEEE